MPWMNAPKSPGSSQLGPSHGPTALLAEPPRIGVNSWDLALDLDLDGGSASELLKVGRRAGDAMLELEYNKNSPSLLGDIGWVHAFNGRHVPQRHRFLSLDSGKHAVIRLYSIQSTSYSIHTLQYLRYEVRSM